MSFILAFLYCASTVFAALNGRGEEAGRALLEGAQAAVVFSLNLAGGICLWSAVSELLDRCGGSRLLSLLLRPLLSKLFPHSSKDPYILSSLSENLSANILGLGNAATPAGIRAAKAMAEKSPKDELCMLVLLNSASVQLIPGTVAAMRQAAGSASAFDILPAVWFSSAAALAAGLLAAAVLRRLWP